MLSEQQILKLSGPFSKQKGITRAAATNSIRKTICELVELSNLAEKELGLVLSLDYLPPAPDEMPQIEPDDLDAEGSYDEEETKLIPAEDLAPEATPVAEKSPPAKRKKKKNAEAVDQEIPSTTDNESA